MTADLPVDDGTLDLSAVKVGDARPFKMLLTPDARCQAMDDNTGYFCTRSKRHRADQHIATTGLPSGLPSSRVLAVWPVDPPDPKPGSRVGMRVTARLGESVVHGVCVSDEKHAVFCKPDGATYSFALRHGEWDVTFTPVLPTTPGSLVWAKVPGRFGQTLYLGHDTRWRVVDVPEAPPAAANDLTNVTVVFDAAPPA